MAEAQVDLGSLGALLGAVVVQRDGQLEVVWLRTADREVAVSVADLVVCLAGVVLLLALGTPFDVDSFSGVGFDCGPFPLVHLV